MTEQGSFPQLHSILDAVEQANPMDSDDDGSDDDMDDDDDDDDDEAGRLHSLPGIKGEAKVVMLSDDVLAMIEKQKNGEAPKPLDDDSEDEDDVGDGEDELFDEEVQNKALQHLHEDVRAEFLEQMDAQQLSNTLWALARLEVALPDTVLTLARELADRQANSQDMGNAVWALAHLNCTSAEQLQVQYSQLQLASLNCTVSVGLSIQTRGLDARLHLHKI